MSIASPCINLCRMNGTTGYCDGCLRTIAEIAGWSKFDDEEKRRVLTALAERRATLPASANPAEAP